ncbi:MAG TPA: redox-regulated ATPase YchF [Candidatus Absconditabacterales bacterium]|nr:redox-regulated ATPase YchF [Candidatus Absconditabacterales bacterium]
MKIGIIGLPNVGKSTLFNALTKSYAANAANFPFCTIEPNVGIVDVKDSRLDHISKLMNTQKTIFANTKFVDIAGLVKGASQGEGLGNKFLSHIREVDALVQVIRYFSDSDITHVHGTVNPVYDADVINTELIIADLESVEKNHAMLQKIGHKRTQDQEILFKIYGLALEALNAGKFIFTIRSELAPEELKILKGLQFITDKEMIYAVNVAESDLSRFEEIEQEISNKLNTKAVCVCAKMESELIPLDEEEKKEYLEAVFGSFTNYNQVPTLDRLITLVYHQVGMMYYFTAGEKECRARSIPKGSTAPQAAGVIHSDFEKGFIRAEVVNYSDLLTLGGRNQAKMNGKLKQEGKEYIVQDGDVMLFKFNV